MSKSTRIQPAMAWLPCRWSLEVEKTVKTLKGIKKKKVDTDRGEKKIDTERGEKKIDTERGGKKMDTERGEKKVDTERGEKKINTDRGEKKVEKSFIRDNYSFESLREFSEWTMVRI